MKRRIALAALMALTFVGASWELNPLVTRTAQPTGPVPAGCEESLAQPATPRVIVAEIPERDTIVPVSLPPAAPPPSRSLREELDSAYRALTRNDRPQFDEHLRSARAIVETYPTGAERSRAEEVLWALNDAAVLWDAQFDAPFFDETSDAYTRASRYPGYADTVRKSALTDDSERRFYPAAESREFVTRVAAERLQRLGIRGVQAPPTRIARGETTESPRVTRRSTSSSSTPRRTTTTTPTTRRASSSTPRRTKSSKPAAPVMAAPSSSPDPSAAASSPAPAEPAPTAPPASTNASAPPVAEDVPAPAMTDSATTTAAPVSAEPAAPAPETSTAAVPQEKRSVVVPALLILIGLGVLIVLFRASK